MKERIDVDLVTRLVKRGVLKESTAKEWLALPLMMIDMRPTTAPGKEFYDFLMTRNPDHTIPFIPSMKTFILDECMVYSMGIEFNRYGRIKVLDDNRFEIQMHIATVREPYATVRYIGGFDNSGRGMFEICDLNDKPFKPIEQDRVFVQTIGNNYVQGLLVTFQYFCIMNNMKDRYAMSVQEHNPKPKLKTGKKGKLSQNIGPRIIYLDEFPTEHKSGEESDGHVVKPHKRRGHHFTLRADRYKNNPFYMVENVLWKKPIWIGDRTAIVNGSVYTVLDE